MKWNTFLEGMSANNIPFANDQLAYLDTDKIDIDHENVLENGSVDLSLVVGTQHPDYGGRTWGELIPVPGTSKGNFTNNRDICLQPLKRAVPNIQSLEHNPDYYFSAEPKETWTFYHIDGLYYIAEGNNRTVIGRLFLHLNGQPTVVHGVRVKSATWKRASVKLSCVGFFKRILEWMKIS